MRLTKITFTEVVVGFYSIFALVLSGLHFVMPDAEIGWVILHATLPYWTLAAIALIPVAFVWRLGRAITYGLLITTFVFAFELIRPMYGNGAAPGTPMVKVFVANLYVGNTHRDGLLREMGASGADILVLSEVDDAWRVAINTAAWRADYRFQKTAERDDPFGMMVLSKVPLSQVEIFDLNAIPQIAFQVTLHDRTVRMLSVHLSPPLGHDDIEVLSRQVRMLRSWVAQPGLPPPIILGDLNLTPYNPLFRELTHEQLVSDAVAAIGGLPRPTWKPLDLSIPYALFQIDHVLVSPLVRVHNIRYGTGAGSDHIPLIAELSW